MNNLSFLKHSYPLMKYGKRDHFSNQPENSPTSTYAFIVQNAF